MSGGTLEKFIEQRIESNDQICEIEACLIMKQIYSALHYFHNQGLIHANLNLCKFLLISSRTIASFNNAGKSKKIKFNKDSQFRLV